MRRDGWVLLLVQQRTEPFVGATEKRKGGRVDFFCTLDPEYFAPSTLYTGDPEPMGTWTKIAQPMRGMESGERGRGDLHRAWRNLDPLAE